MNRDPLDDLIRAGIRAMPESEPQAQFSRRVLATAALTPQHGSRAADVPPPTLAVRLGWATVGFTLGMAVFAAFPRAPQPALRDALAASLAVDPAETLVAAVAGGGQWP